MLDKLANWPRTPVSPPQLSIAENLSSRDEKNMSGDVPGHVFENKNLVITIKDALKENNENQAIQSSDGEDEELDRKSDRSQNKSKHSEMKMKSSESKKDVNRLTTRSMKPVFALWREEKQLNFWRIILAIFLAEMFYKHYLLGIFN